MKRCLYASAAVLAVALIGLAVWTRTPREPEFAGKPLSYYLNQMAEAWDRKGAIYFASAHAIRQMGEPAVPYLIRAVKSFDAPHHAAHRWLHGILPSTVAKKVRAPRTEHLFQLRLAAIRVLAMMGPSAKAATPDLVRLFGELRGLPGAANAAISVNAAMSAVREIGPEPKDIPVLLLVLKHSNSTTRAYAASCLGSIPSSTPEVIQSLVAMLSTERAHVRRLAAEALGNLRSTDQEAMGALGRLLTNADCTLRISAAAALWKVRAQTNGVLEAVRGVVKEQANPHSMHDPNTFELAFAISKAVELLGQIGGQADFAIPALRQALDDQDSLIRLRAAQALWSLCRVPDLVLPTLDSVLDEDQNPFLRGQAAKTISEICRERKRFRGVLKEMLDSRDLTVRLQGAWAIWQITGKADEVIPIAIDALRDYDTPYFSPENRRLAAELLGEIGPEARAAIPVLRGALKDGWPTVRSEAAQALKRIDPESVHLPH